MTGRKPNSIPSNLEAMFFRLLIISIYYENFFGFISEIAKFSKQNISYCGKRIFPIYGLRLFILGFLLFCIPNFANPSLTSFELKNTYTNGNKISDKDSKEILGIMRNVANAIEEKRADKMIRNISKEKGAFLDVKGLWEYKEIEQETRKEDSYFEVFFFNHDKLIKQKQSKDVLTVRELLQKSGGVEVDLFFESSKACEGKLYFKENTKLEKDMNNPYFIKVRGKWFIYRLF